MTRNINTIVDKKYMENEVNTRNYSQPFRMEAMRRGLTPLELIFKLSSEEASTNEDALWQEQVKLLEKIAELGNKHKDLFMKIAPPKYAEFYLMAPSQWKRHKFSSQSVWNLARGVLTLLRKIDE
jgi:hypothetical protein